MLTPQVAGIEVTREHGKGDVALRAPAHMLLQVVWRRMRVDEIVTWGTLDKIAARIKEHHDAGANHVCVQVLTHDPLELPMAGWRELSALLK